MNPVIRELGLAPYEATFEAMRRFTEARMGKTADEIWLLEHPGVFTLGLSGKEEHVLDPGGIPLVHSDRGGQVTYHGPGQLVVYVLLDLKRASLGAKRLVSLLEQSVIDFLSAQNIQASTRAGAPGVYVNERKIAALGLRVKGGCSYHGLALNVAMDLSPFDRINPCGFPGLKVTQLSDYGFRGGVDTAGRSFLPYLLKNLDVNGHDASVSAVSGVASKPRDGGQTRPTRAQRGAEKTSRIPIKVIPTEGPLPRKPPWIRAKAPVAPNVLRLKALLRQHNLHTVCEEAACPNLGECFGHGTATFMIMGDLCTRRCPFCDVAHGRPEPLDPEEPRHLAEAVALMGLNYVVITSVDRDDLRDGGAGHFAECVRAVRARVPGIRVEILVPDFRARMDVALERIWQAPPDVFNHNLETVPRLYKKVRPGGDYGWSLKLLQRFGERYPAVPTKSGLMLGLGEQMEEVQAVLRDLRTHGCDMLTVGQYLQPSRYHLGVERFVTPEEFDHLGEYARGLGFANVASGPMVRSSYHADRQAMGESLGQSVA